MMITDKTLFAIVDPQDPFVPSLVAGEKQAGQILLLMASRPFDVLYLFYTPKTRTNAFETSREVGLRHPDCEVVLQELPDSDPDDVTSLIKHLSGRVGKAVKKLRNSEKHVCMSNGTPEMRAALLFLVVAGVLPATLLHVGSPAERLFGSPDVKEVRLDTPEPDASNLPDRPSEVERQMDLLEAELAPEPSGRFSELEDALRELHICIGSAKMRDAAEEIATVAPTEYSILLLGETGTGKELFAKLAHRLSKRRDEAFVPVNCAALPKELVESELFGHVMGGFTGAISDHKGVFEMANNGTLFLDEIGEFSTDAQATLLRALQEKEIRPLGSQQVLKVDVRIVSATNRDIQKDIREGRFRQDLYSRLRGVPVRLPPLRERREEIPQLALTFLRLFNQVNMRQKELAKDSLSRLKQHAWSGNVRDLDTVIQESALFAKRDVIEPEDLRFDEVSAPGQGYLDLLPTPSPEFTLDKLIDAVEEHQISKALSLCNGNENQAGKLLGRSRQAINQRKHR